MKKSNRYLFSEMRHMTLTGINAWIGLIFVLPWIIGAVLFFAYPLYRSLIISVSEIVNMREFTLNFVGIKWYKEAVFADVTFIPSLLETSINNLINLPLINIFALIIALLLNRKMKARGLFRTIFFLPVVLGTGFIMQQLLGQDISAEATKMARGLLLPEALQQYLGDAVVNTIQNLLDRLTTVMWASGVQIIIYLSALQSVPASLYEAARVDSADSWESFWLITLPMMAPMIQLNLVYTVIATFSMADNKILDFIQWLAFESGDANAYEFSCAVGWIYCLFVLLVIGILFGCTRKFVNNVKE
ncbi:MAG: sugar ABC transporter permease [Clostridia bacterium]|nr:sugar ABC transporter permease [Clostridia bacterium]